MAEGGRLLAAVIRELEDFVRAGMTTKEVDAKARMLIESRGCRPAFLGYKPNGAKVAYPATLCASVNEGVVHGLPSDRRLEDGDLLKIDLGLIHEGWYLDSAVTVAIGETTPSRKRLMRTTREALLKGIAEARAGNTLGDIGYVIEQHAKKAGVSVVETLTGHGIGRSLHEDPYVMNTGRPGKGLRLEVGMVLAIEPMFAERSGRIKQMKDDSFVTADGSYAAHFEHTIAITPSGPKILTK